MNNLHDEISQRSKWYRLWHDSDHHKLVHWLVFIVIVVLIWVALYGQISRYVLSLQDNGVTVSLRTIIPTASLALDPQTKTVVVGETFSANIVLDTTSKPVDGVDVYSLHYDPTILKVIDDIASEKGTQITPGTVFPLTAGNIVDETAGNIKFGQVAVGGTTFTGRGTLATIHFRAIGKGDSYLKFDFNPGSTVDTNAAHHGKDQLSRVVDAVYTVTAK